MDLVVGLCVLGLAPTGPKPARISSIADYRNFNEFLHRECRNGSLVRRPLDTNGSTKYSALQLSLEGKCMAKIWRLAHRLENCCVGQEDKNNITTRSNRCHRVGGMCGVARSDMTSKIK